MTKREQKNKSKTFSEVSNGMRTGANSSRNDSALRVAYKIRETEGRMERKAGGRSEEAAEEEEKEEGRIEVKRAESTFTSIGY
jgi:hypothetical protein